MDICHIQISLSNSILITITAREPNPYFNPQSINWEGWQIFRFSELSIGRLRRVADESGPHLA